MSGEVVGQRYRIVRLIGAGGMGSVHEATDAVTGMRVAVKLITAEMAKNATLMGRFEREARAAASIDTPHIVKVLDAGTDAASGLPFIVMDYLEGEDVQQLIRRLGPLPPDLALRIVAQACLGLGRAHDARIVHRDIKPANFFLATTNAGQRVVKLLDFGIAKIGHDPNESNAETAGLTRTGSMLGSPLYMSPEQARGHKGLDRRADLWSMGVVLYQALTGRTPHQDTDALGELIIQICTEEPTPVQQLAPWVPPEVAAVAHDAMRFDPADRFQAADDMLDAIRPLLPEGWAIEESMFRPLGEVERGSVQPRLVTQPDAPVPRGARSVSVGAPNVPAVALSAPGAASPPNEPTGASMHSMPAFGTTVGPGGAPGSRTAMLAAGVLAVVAAGGAAAYGLLRSAPVPPPAASAPAAIMPVVATAEAKPRTVKVVILPEDARVEVDGAGVKPNDGSVEVTGAVGSVHKVKVTTPDGEVLRDVAITEGGAIPPKVEGAAPKPGGGKPAAAPPRPTQAAPAPTASPLRLQR